MNKRMIWLPVILILIIGATMIMTQTKASPKAETAQSSTATGKTEPAPATENPIAPASVLDVFDVFSDRDMEQFPSMKGAATYTVSDNSDIHITEEGTYVLSGTAENATIYVEADKDAKIQLILSGLSITNKDFPCIYVISGDKIFVTTIEDSDLTVTGKFRSDGETKTNGVVFCRSDAVLNGNATLTIVSSKNGVVSNDNLKVTGGTYDIKADANAIRANDGIYIAGGTLNLTAGTDGLHAENNDDDSLGIVYIRDAVVNIQSEDDAVHANAVVQIDSGTISLNGWEGIEGTRIQINGGTINISARDDGINGANKSKAYISCIEINGGEVNISATQSETDGIDTNGNLAINGGILNISGDSPIDCSGTMEFNGGTVIINGEDVDTLPNNDVG